MVLKQHTPQVVEGQLVESMQKPKSQLTNVIQVYAIEETVTHKDDITAQGFGYSTPLSAPVKKTHFRWQGKLHGSGPGVTGNSNSNETLDGLAENWSSNYLQHPNPAAKAAKQPSYGLDFSPPSELKGARPLTMPEREQFIDAFRKANMAAAGNKQA
ncbi:MAG: hypothetical protein NTU61_06250 [Candidatus Altiarchaeota archaeon]|nr:hypothetical protein [Candidatus Altiarchaeota archaeon]